MQNQLCEVCEDILKATWSPGIPENGEDQGPLENWHWSYAPVTWNGPPIQSIRTNPSCILCRLSVHTAEKSWPTSTFRSDTFIQMKALQFTFGNALVTPPHLIQLKVRHRGPGQVYAIAESLVPLSTDQRLYSARRVRVEQSNIELARSWISSCEQRHGCDCEEPTMPQNPSGDHEVPHFRLIDLKQSRLVRASTTWKYWALSYVWGSDHFFFRTKSSTLKQLEEPGGLNKFWNEIPLTIQDAVAVVARLGYRYLWVDSICIVQDDQEAKKAAIETMDLVHGHAFCTIIAACGGHAHQALAGVQPRSKRPLQTIEEVKPGIEYAVVAHGDKIIPSTYYSTRAWMHQEFIFSRRRLIFTETILVFQCRQAFWREDVKLENQEEKVSKEAKLGTGALDLGQSAQHHEMRATEIFQALVQDYSKRNLTYSSDALNAFNGILSSLESSFECTFHYGIPTCAFDWALQFVYRDEPQPESRREKFPSWSWVGRKGEVVYMSEKLTDTWIYHHTWIVWYCRDEDSGRTEPLKTLEMDHTKRPTWNKRFDVTRESKSQRPYIANSDQATPSISLPQPEETLSLFTGSLLNKAKLLQFWTVSVHFRCSQGPGPTNYYRLYGRDGTKAGQLHSDIIPMFTRSSPETLHEFIVIAGLGDIWFKSSRPTGTNTRTIVRECNRGYNVLLIEWHESRSGLQIAERVGRGELNQGAIGNSFEPGPIWKEIILG